MVRITALLRNLSSGQILFVSRDSTFLLLEIQPADQPSPDGLIGKLFDRSLGVARDDVLRYPAPAELTAASVTGSPQHADEAHYGTSSGMVSAAPRSPFPIEYFSY